MKSIYLLLLAVCLMGLSFASPYEWFASPYYQMSGTFNANDYNQSNKFYMNMNTSGSYFEFTALYLDISGYGNFTRISECSFNQTISGYTELRCFDISFAGFTNGTYPARITTNYAGCGGFTPTPDVINCGDIYEFNMTLN